MSAKLILCLCEPKSQSPVGERRDIHAVYHMLGEQHLLSCSHRRSSCMSHFIKLFKNHRNSKNLKLTKFHPKLSSAMVCLQGPGGCSFHQVLSAPRKDICILYAHGECSSCLGSGYCCHFSEDNSLGTELRQEWTGGHLKSNVLRRKKKGLQVLMRNY